MTLLEHLGHWLISRASPENPSTPLSAPAQWLTDWAGGAPTASGAVVNRESALRVSAVYACVRLLAETIGALPLHIYRKVGNKREIADQHPIGRIFTDEINLLMTPQVCRETLTGHAVLLGNGYALIERTRGERIAGLRPLKPHEVTPKRIENRVVYEIAGESFDAENIFHLPGIGYDGIVGYSPIALARQAIGLALATEEHGAKLFANGARLGGMLKHPAKLSKEAAERLRESWQNTYGGSANAWKTAILEEGMTFEAIGMTSEDAQWLENRRFQINEIARIFRVPPHMIQDLEKTTSWGTGIEQQSIGFVTYSLMPWLVRWEQEIKRKLLGPGDYYAKHTVAGLLRGDTKARFEAYGRAILDGWMTRNEARELEDLNPIDGLDDPLQPLNMTPVGEAPPDQTQPQEDPADAQA